MHHAKRLVIGLLAGALLCGCGGAVKPPQGHGLVDSPLTNHPNRIACLRADHLPIQVVSPTELQIGPPPSGATVRFEPTPGAAQAVQIEGIRSDQGAEVIGAALLFPHHAPASMLSDIEDCLSVDVKG